MEFINYKSLNWENTSYSGIQSNENAQDEIGDRLRYFKLEEGAAIPHHTHKGYEKIVIISGLVKFLDIELSEGDILYIRKGEEHSAVAIKETLMLVINDRL